MLLAATIARAGDTAPTDCGKNHYILDDPIACLRDAGPLKAARLRHTATLLADGHVLAAGGMRVAETGAEVYDPRTATWALTGPLNHAREFLDAALLLDGRVLIVGTEYGYTDDGLLDIEPSAELFDPGTNQWTPVDGPLTPRLGASLTMLVDGTVLLAGGWGSAGLSSSAELFDPRTGRWTAAGEMQPRYRHTATRLADGRVLVIGGLANQGTRLQAVEEAQIFDPSARTWSPAASLAQARAEHAAVLLPDGKVLVAGGYDWSSRRALDTAELYDPVADRWTPAPSLASRRYAHTLNVLGDGSVLAAGGIGERDGDARVVATLERLDALSGAWREEAVFAEPRYLHSATLLRDGSILFAGGSVRLESGSPPSRVNSAELYFPSRRSPR